MYLLLGNSRIESCDYEGVIRLFEHARAQMQPHLGQGLSMVSLVSFLMAIFQHIETAPNL